MPILILQFLDFFGTILEPFVYLMGSLKPFKKSLNKKPKPWVGTASFCTIKLPESKCMKWYLKNDSYVSSLL